MSTTDNHLHNTKHHFDLDRCKLPQTEVFRLAERMVHCTVQWKKSDHLLKSLIEGLREKYVSDLSASWIFATTFVLMCDKVKRGEITTEAMYAYIKFVADEQTAMIVEHFDTDDINYYRVCWILMTGKLELIKGSSSSYKNQEQAPPTPSTHFTPIKMIKHLVKYTILHAQCVSEDTIMYMALHDLIKIMTPEERREVDAEVYNMPEACRNQREKNSKTLMRGQHFDSVDTVNILNK